MRPWHVHGHDLGLAGLVAAELLVIGVFLGAGYSEGAPGVGGWRRVDIAEVSRRVEAGDLSAREALWYREATAADRRQ